MKNKLLNILLKFLIGFWWGYLILMIPDVKNYGHFDRHPLIFGLPFSNYLLVLVFSLLISIAIIKKITCREKFKLELIKLVIFLGIISLAAVALLYFLVSKSLNY